MIVRFEFHGGCKDGVVVTSLDKLKPSEHKSPADIYLFLTKDGTIGTILREPMSLENRLVWNQEFLDSARKALKAGEKVPLGKFPPDYQLYEVTDRQEGPNGILIRMEYKGDESRDYSVSKEVRLKLYPIVNTLDDIQRLLMYGVAGSQTLPGLSPLKKKDLSTEDAKKLQIIDAMTSAERRHPSTLIDRTARERIAHDASVTPLEVERLVKLFEECVSLSHTKYETRQDEIQSLCQIVEVIMRPLLPRADDHTEPGI